MKSISLALALFTLPALAADHIITWSPNPPEQNILSYTLWEQLGASWTVITTVQTNTIALIGVTPGWHVYSLSSSNALGASQRSATNSAFVPIFATPPTNIIINLRASIQSSPSVGAPWKDFAQITIPMEAAGPQTTFRARLDWNK
jgi:hypothetical protein